jgi:hypothetical protein
MNKRGGLLRLKAQITFTNESKLFVKEYLFENKERKYAYHWTDVCENLICRWDNANHWPDISTSPHHKYTGNQVLESTETSVADVLNRISEQMETKTCRSKTAQS